MKRGREPSDGKAADAKRVRLDEHASRARAERHFLLGTEDILTLWILDHGADPTSEIELIVRGVGDSQATTAVRKELESNPSWSSRASSFTLDIQVPGAARLSVCDPPSTSRASTGASGGQSGATTTMPGLVTKEKLAKHKLAMADVTVDVGALVRGAEAVRSSDQGRFKLGDVRLQRASEVSIPAGGSRGCAGADASAGEGSSRISTSAEVGTGSGGDAPSNVGAGDIARAARALARGEHHTSWLQPLLATHPFVGSSSARFKSRWSFEHKGQVRYDLTEVRSGCEVRAAAVAEPAGELEREWCGQRLPQFRSMGGAAAERAGRAMRVPRGPGRDAALGALGESERKVLALASRAGRGLALKALDCVVMVARVRMQLFERERDRDRDRAKGGADGARATVATGAER